MLNVLDRLRCFDGCGFCNLLNFLDGVVDFDSRGGHNFLHFRVGRCFHDVFFGVIARQMYLFMGHVVDFGVEEKVWIVHIDELVLSLPVGKHAYLATVGDVIWDFIQPLSRTWCVVNLHVPDLNVHVVGQALAFEQRINLTADEVAIDVMHHARARDLSVRHAFGGLGAAAHEVDVLGLIVDVHIMHDVRESVFRIVPGERHCLFCFHKL